MHGYHVVNGLQCLKPPTFFQINFFHTNFFYINFFQINIFQINIFYINIFPINFFHINFFHTRTNPAWCVVARRPATNPADMATTTSLTPLLWLRCHRCKGPFPLKINHVTGRPSPQYAGDHKPGRVGAGMKKIDMKKIDMKYINCFHIHNFHINILHLHILHTNVFKIV